MMKPRTLATLQRLRDAEWFTAVGTEHDDSVHVVGSWSEAAVSCSSPEWEDLCAEAVKQYRQRLLVASLLDFAHFNDVVRLVRPEATVLVEGKTADVVALHSLPRSFSEAVSSHVVALLTETEFSDVVEPGFHGKHADWYLKGRLPCGWRGPFPDGGRLVVY